MLCSFLFVIQFFFASEWRSKRFPVNVVEPHSLRQKFSMRNALSLLLMSHKFKYHAHVNRICIQFLYDKMKLRASAGISIRRMSVLFCSRENGQEPLLLQKEKIGCRSLFFFYNNDGVKSICITTYWILNTLHWFCNTACARDHKKNYYSSEAGICRKSSIDKKKHKQKKRRAILSSLFVRGHFFVVVVIAHCKLNKKSK